MEPSSISDCYIEETRLNQAIPDSTSKITSENKTPVVEVINYLNEKTYAAYKPSTYKTKEMIRARVREGFTLEDFKKVIDLKACRGSSESEPVA